MKLETKRDLWIIAGIFCLEALIFVSLSERALNLPLLIGTVLLSIQIGRYEDACDRRERRRRKAQATTRDRNP